ncbi:MAG: pyruvate formate lyase-activating protein [Clostridia bacterium]|nr:pyruvate formate lyase-activating protein [Clostridia bacterium]
MIGYIHSCESFGTVDGPGIRYVVFMQGCPLRCLYCHNPDTWDTGIGQKISAAQILEEYQKNRSFYKNGGITVTGGEPLLQVDFLIELFSLAKEQGIHTCIDTSGATYNPANKAYCQKLNTLLGYTDLVILDIKHIDPVCHKKLTGSSNDRILQFAKFLNEKNIPVWVRHVVVEGYTDSPEHLFNLGLFIGNLKNVKALDVIPYHTLGVNKYKQLNIKYALEGLEPLSNHKAAKAKEHILNGIKQAKTEKPL